MQINSRLFAYFTLESNLSRGKFLKVFREKGGAESAVCCCSVSPTPGISEHSADHMLTNLLADNEEAPCNSEMSRCLQR